jgi:vancomycin resistance protein YoaR
MSINVRLAICAGWVVLIGTSTWIAHRAWVPPEGPIAGVRVLGEALPQGVDPRQFVAQIARRTLDRTVKVTLQSPGGESVVAEKTLAELGLSADVETTATLIDAVGRDAPMLERVDLASRARKGEIDLPLLLSVDPEAVARLVDPLREGHDCPPVEARLDLDRHAVIPEKDGRYIDLDGTIASLLGTAATPGQPVVRIAVRSFQPQVSGDKLSKIAIGTVLASYETRFGRTGSYARRARNIEVAAARINGLLLQPGQLVSFNEVVGARSEENGFQKAGEIFRGEMIEGVGGGTCQVASTLHAATMFGGLDILERLPHSRPSAYIPLGLDATVVYPAVDFKFRNPFTFPVVIHAQVTTSTLRVEVLGGDKPVAVSFSHNVVSSSPYTRKIVEDDTVEKPTTKQKGLRGVTIRRARVLNFSGGQRKVETTVDTYPPTIEIYRVPKGFDAKELPPLPDAPTEEASEAG